MLLDERHQGAEVRRVCQRMAGALEQVAQRVCLVERDACGQECSRHVEAVHLHLTVNRGADCVGVVPEELFEVLHDAVVALLAPLLLLGVALVLVREQVLLDLKLPGGRDVALARRAPQLALADEERGVREFGNARLQLCDRVLSPLGRRAAHVVLSLSLRRRLDLELAIALDARHVRHVRSSRLIRRARAGGRRSRRPCATGRGARDQRRRARARRRRAAVRGSRACAAGSGDRVTRAHEKVLDRHPLELRLLGGGPWLFTRRLIAWPLQPRARRALRWRRPCRRCRHRRPQRAVAPRAPYGVAGFAIELNENLAPVLRLGLER